MMFPDLYHALYAPIANSRQGDYYWDQDPIHFNVAGNRLYAEAFLAFWDTQRTNFLAASE